MLIKIDTQEYPVSLQEFFSRHRNVSFPAEIPFDDFGYAQVVTVPQPEVDFYHATHELPPTSGTEVFALFSGGFIVNQNTATNINISDKRYIFLVIA